MKDEIKEILTNCEKAINEASGYNDTTDKILDYITNLQKTNKNHSKKLIELGDKITNLRQIEQDHKETNATLMSELAKLEEENEKLKEQYKEWKENHKAVCIQRDNILDNIVKDTEKRIDYKSRCEKASNKLSFIDEALENNTLNVPLCITKINSALNILQNGSEKMDNKRLEKWKLKTKGIFHKITYDEFWLYIDDLMKENKKLTNNWNELEEWLKERIKFWEEQEQKWIEAGWMKFGGEANSKIIYQGILDKMKEIKEKKNVE